MNVYMSVCIGDVEEDASIDQIADAALAAVAEKFKYCTVSLNDVEVG